MSAKTEKPVVTTYADHEVILPDNPLRKLVSEVDAAGADDPVARAEKALAELSPKFPAWMNEECERLDRARHALKAEGFAQKTHSDLFHAAHDIKGEATTFGFPPVSAVADSLCRLLEHTPDIKGIPLSLVEQHVDAVRAICREYSRFDTGPVADELTRRLREVTDDFLVGANKHRPQYLDGIIAASPSLTPDAT